MSNNESDEQFRRERLAEEDFRRMSELYRNDPEAFSQEARRRIDEAINNADPRNHARLRGMQFQIDAKLAHYKDPVARMNEMVRLFWKGVGEFDAVLHGKSLPTHDESATVLSFEPHKK